MVALQKRTRFTFIKCILLNSHRIIMPSAKRDGFAVACVNIHLNASDAVFGMNYSFLM